ncbi:MAG: hypothetical protein AMJ43_08890 [Coxiella sp. DG_40]|nr:MAG: hypothetical protein AMJ43_08890 [Coxiella sp. DG_40]
MSTGQSPFVARLYIHDHLFSPVVLIASYGTVLERYEYDAYGNCHILEPNFADDPDDQTDYENPYLFTGRRVDILDNSSLKIQYSRNRYYDYYTGRWLSHDPLGITPNAQMPNRFSPIGQYQDGLCLYEYVTSDPVIKLDPYGIFNWPKVTWSVKGKGCAKTGSASITVRKKLIHAPEFFAKSEATFRTSGDFKYITVSKKKCKVEYSPWKLDHNIQYEKWPIEDAYVEAWAKATSPDASAAGKYKAYVFDEGIWRFGVKNAQFINAHAVYRRWDPPCCCLEVNVSGSMSIEQKLNTTKPGAAALIAVGVYYGGHVLVAVVKEASIAIGYLAGQLAGQAQSI